MKKTVLAAGGIWLLASSLSAQQTQGKVTYERTSQVQMQIAGLNPDMDRLIPKVRTDKFELSFANNQSLWKAAEADGDDGSDVISNGGMQIHMIVAGSNDVLFSDFSASKRVERREVFDKTFIVDDSVRALKWKMGEETKTILNHLCRKATATNISTRTTMNVNNGNVERKEIQDTANITAWFATDIPVSAGPAEYQGQLPGLILALDVNNGRQVFEAKTISEKADVSSIKEPAGKKHYTVAEFNKERDKMMEEMRSNNGGQRVFRSN